MFTPGVGGVNLRVNPQVSVLVSSPSAGGTVAAVRSLGAAGYNVGVLYNSQLSAAVWSRYAARAYRTPPETDTGPFLARLLEIGAQRPGQVLLASSDETAWLYADNASTLSGQFVVYQPPIETIRRILDKSELAAAAKNVAIATPSIWEPFDGRDLADLSSTLPYPVLIKPRTHVQRINNDKGVIIHSREELMRELDAFVARESRLARESSRLANPKPPLLQRFVQSGSGAVSITGFIDRAGELFATRRCAKVLQRLTATGVGLCFEALPPDKDLSDAVRRLCRELGYFGIFEVEFLWMEGRWALIDFNPRLFNQVGLDISREMPLPLLACLDAIGETRALQEAVERAQAYDQTQPAVIYDGFTLRATLLAQALTRSPAAAEREKWKLWMKKHSSHAVGFATDRRDWAPAVVHALSEAYLGLLALPRFLQVGSEKAASGTAITTNKVS